MTDSGSSMKVRLIKGVAKVPKDGLKVYLITDLEQFAEDQHLSVIESALKGGVTDLQLREKNLSLDKLFSLAMVLRQMTNRYGARLYINDRLDIALMVSADGVHLPETGLPPNEIKGRYPHLLIGASTHSLEGALRAEENGADFITFSPIYDTPSKRQYGAPQGVGALKEVTSKVNLPVLALGGITLEKIPEVLDKGAHGVALIRGIWDSNNIEETASAYMKVFKGEPS